MNGSLMASEPAAMMHCSKRIFCALAIRARDFHDMRARELAHARDHFDLALLRQHRQAADQFLDDAVLPAEQLGQVDFRRAEFDAVALISPTSSMTLAACSSALDGMQPTFRQTPPSMGQRSTSVTLRPRSAARNAAV